jgi:hypothetical protein
MKTNAELSVLVTQAVNVLNQHALSHGLKDKEALTQMGGIFQGHACRKAEANASPNELSKLVRSAVNVLKKHESPEIYCDHEAMNALHFIFDGQRCRKALRVKPQKRSELFHALRACTSTAPLPEANIDAKIRELRMTIFLREPGKRLRWDPDANFLTLMKAIKDCPATAQERPRKKKQVEGDSLS